MASRGLFEAPTNFSVTQRSALLTTFRRRAGVESTLLITTSMWPSLNKSPNAAPRAVITAASPLPVAGDRKSTRLNSSHDQISYAVFCLKKKKQHGKHLG